MTEEILVFSIHLDHVVSHRSSEDNISQEARVVAGAETNLIIIKLVFLCSDIQKTISRVDQLVQSINIADS